MSNFQMPVELFMSAPVHTATPDEALHSVLDRLRERSISSLAVMEGEKLVGVISMTDLIRVGRRQAGSTAKADLLTLPDSKVSELMTTEVVTVGPQDPVATASKRMLDGHFHRLYVQEDNQLVGILSTRDVMLAIRDKQVSTPIADWMSAPVFTVRAEEPISLAAERLELAKVTGLVVVNERWPIGLFTQREALASRDHSRDTPSEEVMTCAFLALDEQTPLHRAAAQASELQVRRVVALRNDQAKGILTGLDFARATL